MYFNNKYVFLFQAFIKSITFGSIVQTVNEDLGALVHDAPVGYGGRHAVDGCGPCGAGPWVGDDRGRDLRHVIDELVRHAGLCVTS